MSVSFSKCFRAVCALVRVCSLRVVKKTEISTLRVTSASPVLCLPPAVMCLCEQGSPTLTLTVEKDRIKLSTHSPEHLCVHSEDLAQLQLAAHILMKPHAVFSF